MSDKLAKKVKENQEIAEQEINSVMSNTQSAEVRDKALLMLGGVAAVNQISNMLNAQTLRGLQRIRDEKLFEQLGYARFDFFLDGYEYSPMNYKKFNEREKLLATEGDGLFDVLNTLKLSHRERKLIGAGHVQIDGNTVIVTTGAFGEEQTEEINVNDRAKLLQTLSAIADQAARLNADTIRQKATIDKGSKQVEDLRQKLDEAKNRPGQVSVDTMHFESSMRVTTAINALAELVKFVPSAQKAKYADLYLGNIVRGVEDLKAAYGRKNFSAEETPEATGEFDSILSEVEDEEDDL